MRYGTVTPDEAILFPGKRRVSLSLIAVLLLPVWTSCAWGWGPGHRQVAEQVLAHLPEDIQSRIPPQARQAAINIFSLYPDSMADFQSSEIGDQAVAFLLKEGVKNRYALHSDRGRAAAFVLLVKAFQQHEYAHAALWIAALSHSTADMAAINHDPLVHWLIYTRAYRLQLSDGSSLSLLHCFDLSDLTLDKGSGAAAWDGTVPTMLLNDDGCDAQTALVRIMGYGQQGADFCASRGLPIVADSIAGVVQHDRAVWERSRRLLAELGGWAVGRTVRDTCAAYRLAGSDAEVDLTPAVQEAYEQQNNAFLRQRNLADDALLQPILRPMPASAASGSVPLVGVMVEPTWRMNDAFLGYGDRITAASICRSLGNAGRPYTTLDVRTVLTAALPSPQRMPVVIISATTLHDYGWMKVADLNRQLQSYLEGGGRIIWIGGPAQPPAALQPINEAMTRTPRQVLPATELLHDDAALHSTRLVLSDVKEDGTWPFVRPLVLNVGWTQPLSPWRFDHLSSQLLPLLSLQNGNSNVVVGVLWKAQQPPERFRGAYLPVYCLAPKLLVKSGVLTDPTRPELDEPAREVLFDVLDRLR